MVVLNQNILGFKITMDDSIIIQVEHSIEYLNWIIFDLLKRKFLDLLNDAWQISSCIVCYDDDFLWGLDYVFERDDVGMVNFFEKLILFSEIFEISWSFLSELGKNYFFSINLRATSSPVSLSVPL